MGTQNAVNEKLGGTTSVTTSSYTLLATDSILAVNTSTAVAITLPTPSANQNGRVITIKDSTGSGATHNITVSSSASIDGAATVVIAKNYGSVQLFCDGSSYYLQDSNTFPLAYSMNVQSFTTSGTYTPTAGLAYALIECVGGGGAGGGCGINSSNYSVGSGGGAGGYIRCLISPDVIGSSQIVTIGAGGAGASGAGGGSGGNTYLGSLVSAYGGTGGSYNFAQSNQTYSGGAGGLATTNPGFIVLLEINGQTGGTATIDYAGSSTTVFAGAGGSTLLGFGGVGLQGGNNLAGVAGNGFGSGGSGAMNGASTGTRYAGGAGTGGIVTITEYIL